MGIMNVTPAAKTLYDRQAKLILKAQGQLESSFENEGTSQKAQLLAKALLDLIAGHARLAQELSIANKTER